MENLSWLRTERNKLEDRTWFWGRMVNEYLEYCREAEMQWQDDAAGNFRNRFTIPHQSHLAELGQQAVLHRRDIEFTEQPIRDFYICEQKWTALVRLVVIELRASEAIQHDVSAALQGYSRYANTAQIDLRVAEPLLAQLLERGKNG